MSHRFINNCILGPIKNIQVIGLILFTMIVTGPQIAWAKKGPIVILMSSEIEPYRGAAGGAIDALSENETTLLVLDKNADRIVRSMEKLSLLSPSVVIAIGSQAVLALRSYPIDVPVVFCLVIDHLSALEIPKSYGISMHLSPQEAYNNTKKVFQGYRIGIPYNPERTGFLIKDYLDYFENKHVKLVPIEVQAPDLLGPAIRAKRGEFDALWILPDPSILHSLSIRYIIEYSMDERIPVIGYSESFTKAGAVLSMASSYEDMGRQTATVVNKILSGKYSDRVQSPQRVKRYFNLRVAKLLKISISSTLLAFADRIYPIDQNLRNP